MRIDDELIDGTLRSAPAWQAPDGFGDRVAARGVAVLRADAPVPRLWSWMNISAAVPLAVVTALVLYAIAELVRAAAPAITATSASAPQAAWLWVAVSCGIAAWFARRAYAAD
jgi:hypothetical protein